MSTPTEKEKFSVLPPYQVTVPQSSAEAEKSDDKPALPNYMGAINGHPDDDAPDLPGWTEKNSWEERNNWEDFKPQSSDTQFWDECCNKWVERDNWLERRRWPQHAPERHSHKK